MTKLNKLYSSIDEALNNVPYGIITTILPDDAKEFDITPSNPTTRVEEREGKCLKCESGVAIYEDTYTMESLHAANGANMDKDTWLSLDPKYKELWVALFDAGLLEAAIVVGADGEERPNPLDVDPVQISEPFTEED